MPEPLPRVVGYWRPFPGRFRHRWVAIERCEDGDLIAGVLVSRCDRCGALLRVRIDPGGIERIVEFSGPLTAWAWRRRTKADVGTCSQRRERWDDRVALARWADDGGRQ